MSSASIPAGAGYPNPCADSRVRFIRLVVRLIVAAIVAIFALEALAGTLVLQEIGTRCLYLCTAFATAFALRRSQDRLAAHLLVWGLLASLSCSILFVGGLYAPAVPLFVVLLGVSGWLLGTRPLLAVAAACAALFAVAFAFQVSGLVQGQEAPLSRRLVVLLAIVAATVALTWYIVTSALQAGTELKASEARFRAMTLLSADWYWEVDEHLRFKRVAGRGLENFGLSPEMMIGKPTTGFSDFVPIGESGERYRRARQERKPYRDILMRTTLRNGTTRYVSISGEPLFGADNRFAGFRGVTRDVTEQTMARDEERRLYAALDDFDETFILCDPQDRIVMTSRRFRERNALLMDRIAAGCTYEQYLRLSMPTGYFPEAEGREEAWIAERMERRRRPGSAVEVQRQGGAWLQVHDHRLPDGSTITMARDISAQKHTEDRLVENEARFRAIFESSKAGIATWDLHGRFLTANAAFCDFVGYDAQELVANMTAGNLRYPGEEEGLDLTGKMLLGSITHVTRDRRYVRRDSSVVWGRTTVAGVRGTDGGLQYFVSVVIDITEAHEARERIERLNSELDARVRERTRDLDSAVQRLEEANRELDSFNYSIAHDLRQPLSAIGGFADLLREPGIQSSAEDVSDFSSEIESNAGRMAEMIESLLRFSNVGRGELRRTEVDMQREVESALDHLSCAAPIRAEVTIGDLPAARGDETLLRHVWSNLIGNALKYSGKGESPCVTISGEERDGMLEYTVSDNGVGFDMRHADELFGVFHRLPGSAEFEGTGVGLAIVQRIVRRHGGKISAESAPGQGATFRFALPA